MTKLTEKEQAVFEGYIGEYLEEHALKEMDPIRFRERLNIRIHIFTKRGFKITDVGYGGEKKTFTIYFYNAATGYTVFAKREGGQYGAWTYSAPVVPHPHRTGNDSNWLVTNTPRELFAQMED